jgi:predicted amidohydrolase YtcJ
MASRLTTYIVVLIVTGTVIAGLIVGAQRDDASGPVDLIITNGRVFTGAGGELAEALAVQGNKILRVGSNREIKRLRRPQTLMVDAHGGAVLPGLIDTHVHLGRAASSAAAVDLAGTTTPDAVRDRLGAFAETHPETAWIRGHGWPAEQLADAAPTKALLDEAVSERAALVLAEDGRTAWVNSRALSLAGITRHTPNPNGGVIVRDARTGEPAGVLKDAAIELVMRAVPEPTEAERIEALQAAVRQAHSVGITSVHSIADSEQDLELYDTLRSTGDLRLRVYSAIGMPLANWQEKAGRLDALHRRYPDDPVLKTGAAVVTLDAADDAAGPAPLAPELARLVTFLDGRGWQAFVEPSSETGIVAALDAFEAAFRENPIAARGRRHRLEQIGSLTAPDADRLARLGVTASMQTPDDETEREACRLLSNAGARVTFGSDWPAAMLDPRTALAIAEPDARQHADDVDPAEAPQQTLTLEQAIDAHTSAAAWTSFDDQRKGSLQRGMLADIVILTADIFAPGTRLLDVEVDTTIFDGEVVYTRAAAAGTH